LQNAVNQLEGDSREKVWQKREAAVERKQFMTVKEGSYNLGPNRFVRILAFRNGKLVDIKISGYGYATKQKWTVVVPKPSIESN
jgi:hypothetical protein